MQSDNANESKPRRTAIYIRVSTPEQKLDGYSPEAQRKRLLSYVKDNKALNLYTEESWIFEDVHTGSDMNRDELKTLLKMVDEKKFDAVLVWKIDRMSRSLRHLLEIFERLQKAQASFISVQENIDFKGPIGNLIFQIFGAIAQFERELIKSRTRTGIIASADMGNYTGTNIPYGYKPIPNPEGKKGKRLAIIPAEKKEVERIYEWYVYGETGQGKGTLGDGQIADKLNKLRVPLGKHVKKNKKGEWTEKHIKTILTSEIYRGAFVAVTKDEQGNELAPEKYIVLTVPACVSATLFLLAERRRNEKNTARAAARNYLLSGKLYDVSIPSPLKFAGKPRSKGGWSYRRKQFDDKEGKHYPVFEIPANAIEDAVWQKVKLALKDPEVFIKHHLDTERFCNDRIEQMNEDLLRLRERVVNLNLESERIEAAYEAGVYGLEKTNAKSAKVNTQIGEIESDIERLERDLSFAALRDEEIKGLRDAAAKVRYNIDKMEPPQRKALINLFVDYIELDRKPLPSPGKRTRWDISMQVFFRFVPEKFGVGKDEGRTKVSHQTALNRKNSEKNSDVGGSGGT